MDPLDIRAAGDAMLSLLRDRPRWEKYRESALAHIMAYSWKARALRSVIPAAECVLSLLLRAAASAAATEARASGVVCSVDC